MNFTSLDEAWENSTSNQRSRRFSVSSRPESAIGETRSRSVSPSIESFFSDVSVETRGGNSSSRHRSHSPTNSTYSSGRETIIVGAGSELGNERMVVNPPGATLENVFKDQEVHLVPLSNNSQAYRESIQKKNERIQEGYQAQAEDIAGNMNVVSNQDKDKTLIHKILQIENKLDEVIGLGSGSGNYHSRQSHSMNTILEAGLLIGVGLFILVVMEMMLRMGRQHITYKFKIVD
jgi:hypothetical protein